MNHRAAVSDHAALLDFIFEIDFEYLVFLVPEVLDHVGEVRSQHLRGVLGNLAFEVGQPDQLDAIFGHCFFTGRDAFNIAAGLCSEVDDHGAILHRIDHILLDQDRWFAPEHLGCRNDDIALSTNLSLGFLLFLQLLRS